MVRPAAAASRRARLQNAQCIARAHVLVPSASGHARRRRGRDSSSGRGRRGRRRAPRRRTRPRPLVDAGDGGHHAGSPTARAPADPIRRRDPARPPVGSPPRRPGSPAARGGDAASRRGAGLGPAPADAGRLRPVARARRQRGRRALLALVVRRRHPRGAHRLDRVGHPAQAADPDHRASPQRGAGARDRAGHRRPGPAPAHLEEGTAIGPRRARTSRHLRLRPTTPAEPGLSAPQPICGPCRRTGPWMTPPEAAESARRTRPRPISSTDVRIRKAQCVIPGPVRGIMAIVGRSRTHS